MLAHRETSQAGNYVMMNTKEKASTAAALNFATVSAPIDQGMGDGAQIDIFKLTASRHASG